MSMTDVLKPQVLRLGNFCYRINPGDKLSDNDSLQLNYTEETNFTELEPAGSGADVDSRVKEISPGRFFASVDIPSALFRFIIGKKGDTKRKLEYETRCTIVIPARGVEGAIVIKGKTARSVTSAITRIEVLADSGRQKTDFTHFVSVPMTHPVVQRHYQKFQEQVLTQFSKCHGVDESIFQNPDKLHLTVATLTLLNDPEVTQATEVILSCADELSQKLGSDPRLRIQNLDYMNDDPTAIDVLYAKVRSADNSNSFQVAVDLLGSRLAEAGISRQDFQRDRVKLHVTLMNTLFRKDTGGGGPGPGGRNSKPRETFDAQSMLKVMGLFDFGEIPFPGFHLSKRYSTSCTGYYETVVDIITSGSSS